MRENSIKRIKCYIKNSMNFTKLAATCVLWLVTEEESIKDKTEQEPAQDNTADEFESNDVQFSDSLKSDEMGKSMRMKREDGKLRTLSGRVFNCQGKNLRINIPLTTPSRTLSAISYLVWGDLVNQSSRKCGPEGSKLNINKTKLHHAEKMIKGAFIELYKGLGYLKTYRWHIKSCYIFLIFSMSDNLMCGLQWICF